MSRVRSAVQAWAVAVAVVAVQSAAWGADISAGYYFSCGVNATGAARCWGEGTSGKLGNGTTGVQYLTPVTATGLASGVASISTGDHTACAVTTAGAVRCWGNNSEGQLGNGSIADSNVPVQVSGLTSGVRSVQVGSRHACAVTTSGLLFCWGRGAEGQLGMGNYLSYNVPVQVPGLSGVTAVATGENHTCALLSTGAVRCFGDNAKGQIGTGVAGNRYTTPQQPVGLASGVRAITVARLHSCALMSDSTVRCWGENGSGELGDGTNTQRTTPTLVRTSAPNNPALTGVTSLSAGGSQTCAVAASTLCWGIVGANWYSHVRYPTQINGAISFSRVEVGNFHVCGRTSTNTAFCWGANNFGGLGNNSTTNSYMTPVQVVGF